MNQHLVSNAVNDWSRMRERLLLQYPDLAEDFETLNDTLEGISDLPDLLIAVMRQADEAEMLVTGIDARMDDLKARKERLKRRSEAIRDAVCEAMQRADLPKIEAPDFTVSTRRMPPAVVVTDEGQIPPAYMKEKVTTAPDKAAIKADLEAGKEVPGCAMSNGGVGLTVRRK